MSPSRVPAPAFKDEGWGTGLGRGQGEKERGGGVEGSTGLKCSHVLEAGKVLTSVLNALQEVWGETEGVETGFCGEPKASAHEMFQGGPT